MRLRRAIIKASVAGAICLFTIRTGSACCGAPHPGSLTASTIDGSTTIGTATISEWRRKGMATSEETPSAGRSPTPAAEQRPMGAPVVQAPGLPLMEPVGEVRTVVRNAALPPMGAPAAVEPGENRMVEIHRAGELPS